MLVLSWLLAVAVVACADIDTNVVDVGMVADGIVDIVCCWY